MPTTTETASRPPRAPALSVAITAVAVVAGLLLSPVTNAAAAEPLPPGSYSAVVDDGDVGVGVAADGDATVTAPDGFIVQLRFDDEGRVLDTFTVWTSHGTFDVDIEVADDGSYTVETTLEGSTVPDRDEDADDSDADGVAAGGEDGQDTAAAEGRGDEEVDGQDDTEPGTPADDEIVRTVAACAPKGVTASAMGWPNTGSLVSAAASHLTVDIELTDPTTGAPAILQVDFTTLAGAEAFCAEVAALDLSPTPGVDGGAQDAATTDRGIRSGVPPDPGSTGQGTAPTPDGTDATGPPGAATDDLDSGRAPTASVRTDGTAADDAASSASPAPPTTVAGGSAASRSDAGR